MADIYDIIPDVLRKGEDVVLARVIDDQGSAPRGAGASMLIRKNGEIHGTVGGGLVEATTMQRGKEVFKDKRSMTLSFDMTGDYLAKGKMVCGGKVELLIEFLPANPDTVRIFKTILDNRRSNRKSFLITCLPGQGTKDDSIKRWLLSDNDAPAGSEEESEMLARLKDSVRAMTDPGLLELDGKRYWIDIIVDGGTVYIFGAGHVSREVSDLALRVGFRTVVLDDRKEFANVERFNKPAEVVVLRSFENCFEDLQPDEDSYVVIVTRGHLYDKIVLQQALRTQAGYIGMIGSARKKETVYKVLLEEGFTSGELEKVHCPIGMKIETETPAEIAVSIVGELIDIRARKRLWKKQASRP